MIGMLAAILIIWVTIDTASNPRSHPCQYYYSRCICSVAGSSAGNTRPDTVAGDMRVGNTHSGIDGSPRVHERQGEWTMSDNLESVYAWQIKILKLRYKMGLPQLFLKSKHTGRTGEYWTRVMKRWHRMLEYRNKENGQ